MTAVSFSALTLAEIETLAAVDSDIVGIWMTDPSCVTGSDTFIGGFSTLGILIDVAFPFAVTREWRKPQRWVQGFRVPASATA